jgi:hypothetical protein
LFDSGVKALAVKSAIAFMISIDPEKLDIFLLEDALWIAASDTGLAIYDFAFSTYFACRHPWQRPDSITAVGRFGVTTNYEKLYGTLQASGVRLIHSPQQYLLATELTEWYDRLRDLTPRSVWFAELPAAKEVEGHFDWPVFVKGSRQTNRHKAELSIIHSAQQFEQLLQVYRASPILHWQSLVCREFVSLRPVAGSTGDKVPPSFEFRSFWWYGICVGAGPYWAAFTNYQWNREEEEAALAVAGLAARRLNLPFLVVDVAQTIDGEWLVIECNDGQESGYAGISPMLLWGNIIEAERDRRRNSTAIQQVLGPP